MTRTYHDVEAVTRLLEEKEKDLELAAKIGQELLQRNKESDEKINKLENDFGSASDLITQLRHELQVKTDLLHVYTSDLEDASPLELRSFNVELLQRKITDLEDDNKTIHAEASKLAHEAYACEEKEEKLVKDAVQHLTQANSQIKDLHHQFTHKVDESSRQREEINSLLSQVCDLQNRVQRYSHENDDLTANLRVYQETQDELTTELVDLKDKYREVVELLRDANEEIKRSRKKTYPGMGKHSVSGMFSLPIMQRESGDDSLQAELHSSLRSSKKSSKQDSKIESEVSDSDNDLTAAMGSSAYRKAARTYRAIAKASTGHKEGQSSSDTSKAVGGSIFQSYTISRENSFSPDFEDFEYPVKVGKKLNEDPEVSDDSGTGRSTGLSHPGSLSSSAPKEELARQMLRQATQNAFRSSHGATETSNVISSMSQVSTSSVSEEFPLSSEIGSTSRTRSRKVSESLEVIEVQTVGVLKAPSFHLSSSLLQSTPLGTVPGKNGSIHGGHSLGSVPTTPGASGTQTPSSRKPTGHPTLGIIPGRTFNELKAPEQVHRAGSDYDETEPLGNQLTTTNLRAHTNLGAIPGQVDRWPSDWRDDKDETESCQNDPLTYSRQAMDFDETEPTGCLTTGCLTTSSLGNHGLSSSGSLSLGHPGLGSIPSNSGHPGLGSIPGRHPGIGSVPAGHPGLGSIPGGHPGLGSLPITSGLNVGQPERSQLNSLGLDLNTSWSSQDLSMEEFDNYSESMHQEISSNKSINYRSVKGEPSKFTDSGVISGDYSEDSVIRRNTRGFHEHVDIDGMSDGGFSEMGTYPGIRLASDKEPTDPLSVELESALKHLNPAEVERRRKLMGRKYSYDLGSDGMDSPGAIAGCEEYFKSLPYGVETLESSSLTSDRLFKSRNSTSLSFHNRRLPDKLKIIKPLEGSLTLHNWSRLATPHLGGVLEERCGVALKGNDKAGLDPLFDMYRLSDLEEDDEEDMVVPSVRQPTLTYNTLTNSTVLHPDTTFSTNSYGRTQMSSGIPSRMSTRPSSRMSSRAGSFSDLPGMFAEEHFSNIGLAKLLNEKKISGARRSQLDLSSMSSISSLTPSVLTSPNASKNISPTGTPIHTPEETLPGSPDETSSAGVVYSFFSSLKSAIYGEQRKEHRTSKFKRRMEEKRHNLRIMEAVEEVGIENMFNDKEGTPMSMPALSIIESKSSNSKSKAVKVPPGLSDFDARYLGALDDFDELEDITPGVLTLTKSVEPPRDASEYTKQWIGQLTVPSFSATGRPSLRKRELGIVPLSDKNLKPPSELCNMGGRGPGRIVSPGEIRPNQISGLGVPGHPGTGAVGQAIGAKRQDLGTIPGFHKEDEDLFEYSQENRGIPQSSSFIGSFTNMFFGRKGGYS
eukprot:GFUD01013782.1.p1 GENE.GFUD01013782.1~~GFUD01013782.1.p1  ORF type:complete len:1377 (+),score=309.96 GFUD01013782.1:584-4714(+)